MKKTEKDPFWVEETAGDALTVVAHTQGRDTVSGCESDGTEIQGSKSSAREVGREARKVGRGQVMKNLYLPSPCPLARAMESHRKVTHGRSLDQICITGGQGCHITRN